MSKLSQKILAVAIAIAFLAIAIFYSAYNTHKSVIPEGTVGALPGNLNNKGLFCESAGVVYFSNSYDEGALYSMSPDQTNIKKIGAIRAEYINAGGNSIVFHGEPISSGKGLGSVVQKEGLFIIDKGGKKLSALTKAVTGSLLLVDNNVFYEHYDKNVGTTLAVFDLKKRESTELTDYMVNPVALYGREIYFNGMYDDHHLYTFNVDTHEIIDVFGCDCWNPIRVGDYIYYMDVQNGYRLVRYSLSENVIEIITKERLDFFNIYDGVIFCQVYQSSGQRNPALKRYALDGSSSEIIAEGVYKNINVTSTYVYFKEFGDDYRTLYSPTYGAPNVCEFTAARDAIPLNK